MRIVFFGASKLGWKCCKTLFDINQNVVGIFSIPEKFDISWASEEVENVKFRSFDDLADEHDVPITYVTKKMSSPEYEKQLRALRPDLLIVVGWYYIIPKSLRDIATRGAVGIHASLLPKYRGGAPLVWAVINGEEEAGVTFFHFSEGVDEGDIIAQEAFDIGFEEDISDVLDKSTEASLRLIREYIPMMESGDAPRRSQNDRHATRVPQRKPEDGIIDWTSMTAVEAYNWVRAQTRPYPGAFTYLNGEKIKIWQASPGPESDRTFGPGTVVTNASGAETEISVVCADGRLLHVHEAEYAGETHRGEDVVDVLEEEPEQTILGKASGQKPQ